MRLATFRGDGGARLGALRNGDEMVEVQEPASMLELIDAGAQGLAKVASALASEHQSRQTNEQGTTASASSPPDLVYTSKKGTPIQDGYVSWCFHKTLASASLPSTRQR